VVAYVYLYVFDSRELVNVVSNVLGDLETEYGWAERASQMEVDVDFALGDVNLVD